MSSHNPLFTATLQESYQLIRNENKAGVLLRICLLSYEAEKPLFCFVISAVGYPEETVEMLHSFYTSELTCAEDIDVVFS